MSSTVALMTTSACDCPASSTLSCKVLPPSYTPSPPAPLYSDHPNTGEQSLSYTPRVGSYWFLPDATFTKRLHNATITLYNQEENAQVPQYRQNGLISGCVELGDVERVQEVSLLIEGRLDLCIAEGGNNTTIKTVHSTTTLWKKPTQQGRDTDSDTPTRCPCQLVFAFSLPRDYQDASGTHPLPPTFQTLDFGESGVFARSSYRLRFTIKRTPKLGSRIALLEKTKHIFIPFEYRPRSRSTQPISSCTGSLALIKQLPDEWFQSSTTIQVPSLGKSVAFSPVTAHIFVPCPRVYSLKDSIPFYLQLTGRVDSLRALVAPDTLENTGNDANPTSTCIRRLQGDVSTSLRIFLLRQIRLELKGKVRVQNLILGEATLESLPPVMTDCYRLPVGCREEYLSWTGTLQCGKGIANPLQERPGQATNVDVPGFHAGEYLKVNDFVALSVGSTNPPWKDIRSSIGIKLVTESWEVPNDNDLLF